MLIHRPGRLVGPGHRRRFVRALLLRRDPQVPATDPVPDRQTSVAVARLVTLQGPFTSRTLH